MNEYKWIHLINLAFQSWKILYDFVETLLFTANTSYFLLQITKPSFHDATYYAFHLMHVLKPRCCSFYILTSFKLIFTRHKTPLIDYCFAAWLKDTQMDEISLCTAAWDTDRTAASNERSVQGFFKTTQAKGIKDLCPSMQNTLASFSKEGKNEGIHQGEDAKYEWGGCDKRKKSYMWKKRTLKACLFELFQQRKDAQPDNCVFWTSKYSIKTSIRKNREEKSSWTSGKQTTEYQVISTAFWFGSRDVMLGFRQLLSVVLVKTLISMYIYPSIY